MSEIMMLSAERAVLNVLKFLFFHASQSFFSVVVVSF